MSRTKSRTPWASLSLKHPDLHYRSNAPRVALLPSTRMLALLGFRPEHTSLSSTTGLLPIQRAGTLQPEDAGDYTVSGANPLEQISSIPAQLAVGSVPAAIRITQVRQEPTGSLLLTVEGATGGIYILESSSDLVQWEESQRRETSDIPFVFTESIDAGAAHRYFRVRWQESSPF